MITRYARQTALTQIGETGQRRLRESRVLCVGVGGLGSPAALYLAAAGVGKIGLVDPDTVNISNLQRQILFGTSDHGHSKVTAGKNRLANLNPDIEIETFNESLNDESANRILSRFDLVIDGSDNFETKFLINDASCKFGIPLVYGAVEHFEGQVALFHGKYGACYRCLHPSLPKAQIQNCAQSGVLGALAGTIGTLQATLALQYLISGGDPGHTLYPNLGELTLLDLTGKWKIRSVQIPKISTCPTCSHSPDEIVLHSGARICALTLAPMLADPKSKLLLLDVRDAEEWAQGHISGAIHWPISRLEQGELPSQARPLTTVIAYCRSGHRSQRAAQLLIDAGISSACSLTGGIESWPDKLITHADKAHAP